MSVSNRPEQKGLGMQIKVATFNLNNLFSRYNFRGEIAAVNADASGVDGDVE